MKKRSQILIGIISTIVVCFSVCLAIFIPKETKADPIKQVVANEVNGLFTDSVSSIYNGSDTVSITEKGGSLYLEEDSYFEMNGGTIENHERRYGGAIYVSSGATFIMNGGTIKNNHAKYGGAIYVEDGGKLILNAGTIENNIGQFGLSIYVEKSESEEDDKVTEITIADGFTFSENVEGLYDYAINYYVDGELVRYDPYSLNENEVTFSSYNSPLSYENCPGYFIEDYLLNGIEDGEIITPSTSSEDSYFKFNEEAELNLYTKTVTSDAISFVDKGADVGVKVNGSASGGEVVLPNEYKGKPVTQLEENELIGTNNAFITNVCLSNNIEIIKPKALILTNSLVSIYLTRNVKKCEDGFLRNRLVYVENVIQTIEVSDLNETYEDCDNNGVFKIGGTYQTKIKDGELYSLKKLVIGCKNTILPTADDSIEVVHLGSNSLTNTDCSNIDFSSVVAAEELSLYYAKNIMGSTLSNLKIAGNHSFKGTTTVDKYILSSLVEAGSYAFDSVKNVKGSTLTNLQCAGSYAFNNTTTTDNYKLNSIVVVDDYAFYNTKIDGSTMSYLEAVGDYAFYKTTSSTNYGLTKLKSVGDYAFGDYNLTATTSSSRFITGDIVVNLQSCLYYTDCMGNLSFDAKIGYSAFAMSQAQTIVANGGESIGEYAFYSNKKAKTITVSAKVIKDRAFQGCNVMTTLNLNEGVEQINYLAFDGCLAYDTLIIPSSVKNIGYQTSNGKNSGFAFARNTSLLKVYIPSTVEIIGSEIFQSKAQTTNKGETITYDCQPIIYTDARSKNSGWSSNFTKNALHNVQIPVMYNANLDIFEEGRAYVYVNGVGNDYNGSEYLFVELGSMIMPPSHFDHPETGLKTGEIEVFDSTGNYNFYSESYIINEEDDDTDGLSEYKKFVSWKNFYGYKYADEVISISTEPEKFTKYWFEPCWEDQRIKLNIIDETANNILESIYEWVGEYETIYYSFQMNAWDEQESVYMELYPDWDIINGLDDGYYCQIGYGLVTYMQVVVNGSFIDSVGSDQWGDDAICGVDLQAGDVCDVYLTRYFYDNSGFCYPSGDNDRTTIINYKGSGGSITIPDSVTKIGSGAFSGNTNISKLNLNNVSEIGNSAFYGCTGITEVILSTSNIGARAFAYCTGLRSVVIYGSGYHQDDFANSETIFWGCNNLTSIAIMDVVSDRVVFKISNDKYINASILSS